MKALYLIPLVVFGGACVSPTLTRLETGPPAPVHPVPSLQESRRLVSFHQERVKNDPQGAIGWAMLGESQLGAASQIDSDQLARDAEASARQSLKVRTRRNGRAAMLLVKSLLAQHRFKEALQAADLAVSLDPESKGANRQRLEVLLELGRYEDFKKGYGAIASLTDPASLAVQARWAGLTGKPEREVALLSKAASQVDAMANLSGSTVAAYRTLLAGALFRSGKLAEADSELDEALKLDPASYQAKAWKTRLAASQGDDKEVLHWAAETAKSASMTDIEGLAVEAELRLGRRQEAEARLKRVIASNLPPGVSVDQAGKSHGKSMGTRHTHDRLLSLLLADLGRHLQFAHHAAEEDLQNRRDIYAEDAFAWSTYRYWELVPASITKEGDGLLREAEKAALRALSTGTKDPKILFHAGTILSHSNRKRGESLLAEASKINPRLIVERPDQERSVGQK